MVEHRPHGIEHPYATSLDQRVPVLPMSGERVLLGVQAVPEVAAVTCDWAPLDETGRPGAPEVLRLDPRVAAEADAAALAGGEGHLAAAQAAQLGGEGGWAATTPPVDRPFAYRFHARTGDGREHTTDWYTIRPARWVHEVPDGLAATCTGGGQRVVDGSLEWLVTDTGVERARLALALRPGDHVVGLGERYDALDQAGRTPDAVVFEQYKSQGRHRRTYLPMPFAHVVGADGGSWGFHVRTTRRTWYDVGAADSGRLEVEVALGGSTSETLDVGVFEGTPTEVLTAFLDEVGRAEELPSWVFRLWASGNEWNTQRLVRERMDTHRELDIPVGVVVIEAWSDEEGIMIFRDA
ncbi:glycoside hydrolase family 31, partial [Phycicoccus sp. CMS6Z-2]|nr:glycoside hydrolase family 31 [Phycicoccus flavus]